MRSYAKEFTALLDRLASYKVEELGFYDLAKDQFERELEHFVTNTNYQDFHQVRSLLRKQLAEGDFEASFIAYICLAILYIRSDNLGYLEYLYNDDNQELISQIKRREIEGTETFLTYYHSKILRKRMEFDRNSEFIDLKGELLQKSYVKQRKVISDERFKNHVAALHHYAEVIVTICERRFNRELYDRGREHLLDIIRQSERQGKYIGECYATLSRYELLMDQFDPALKNIKKAIIFEQPSFDYQIRISKYYLLETEIRTKQQIAIIQEENDRSMESIEEKNKALERSMDENREILKKESQQHSRFNLQILGLFTAVISFIIGSFEIISNQQNFLDSTLLLIVLTGCIITVFSILNIPYTKREGKNLRLLQAVVVMGLLMIISPLLTYFMI